MTEKRITPAFKKAYQELNPSQKEAVDTIEGPVMVIAGPGTGKTQIVATRIANILLNTDTHPSAILALTFTDSAAVAMRDRLIQLIGQPAYRIHISTFHSFCSQIIKDYPDYFTIAPQAQPLTDLERFQIIHTILDENDFDLLKPTNSPYYYAKAIVSALQDLKREAVEPSDFKQIIKDKLKQLNSQKDDISATEFNKETRTLNKNLELVKIYYQYQELLQEKGRYDFADMINFVIDKFQDNQELLAQFQERFHYFLVDEYQDTNSAQNKIANLLTSHWGEQANIFVVGDDQQSIYRFAGASLENPLEFMDQYPDAKVITLKKNYRSQQTILDAAHQLISYNDFDLQNVFSDLDRQLESQTDLSNKQIDLVNLEHQLVEQNYIALKIKQLIKEDTSPDQISIIVRNNADLNPLADILRHHQIPFSLKGNQDVLNSTVIKYLIKLFKVIDKSRQALDDLDLFTVLHYPFFNIDSLQILKLSRHASQQKTTLVDVISKEDFPQSEIVDDPEKFTNFLKQLHSWHSLDSQTTFTEFVEKVLEQSNLLKWALDQPNSSLHLVNLNAFFSQIKSINQSQSELDLNKFLEYLELMHQNKLTISQPDLGQVQKQVTLTTAHRAKGLEWDHVFIFQAIDGHWGNQTIRQLIKLPPQILKKGDKIQHDPIEDERRLFYVAMTRAKRTLTITHADTYNKNGRSRQAVPSQFISEIPKEFIQKKEHNYNKEQLEKLLIKLLKPAVSSKIDDKQAQYLESIIKDFKLSVTALNTYLECPYKFKLNNLFKVPKAKQPYLSFGTAVHTALEKFHSKLKKDKKTPSKSFLIEQFKQSLKQEILTPQELDTRLDHGEKVLSAYYDLHHEKFSPAYFVERYFGGFKSQVFLDDIQLSGKIDRIDLLDQNAQTVRLVDYKTGKRKTKGQIKGTTKNSQGDLKRQLVFYKLLVDLDNSLDVQVKTTQLDFVEAPYKEDKEGREEFSISDEEVSQLKEIIKKTVKQIRNLNFPRTDDKSVCSRCDFKDHCWPKGIPQSNSDIKTT